jgi:hypothetical protein
VKLYEDNFDSSLTINLTITGKNYAIITDSY